MCSRAGYLFDFHKVANVALEVYQHHSLQRGAKWQCQVHLHKYSKFFYDTIDKMERESDQFVNRPGKDFSRHRICTFKDTIFTIITKETHSLKAACELVLSR